MYGKEEGRQKMKKDYDEIRIEDLEVFANHGVFPEENVLGQKFLVSAVLYTDTRRAGLTDDLSAAVSFINRCSVRMPFALSVYRLKNITSIS